MTESVILSIGGGLIGVGAALAVLTWGGLAVATEGVNIEFSASPTLAATGLVVSLAVGFLAGAMPSLRAARAEIVTSLNDP